MGNHTLFCLILSLFCHVGLVGCVYGGAYSVFFLLLVWVGVYVREHAILPSIGLFVFFF